jgi:hypothetical protein
MIFPLKRKGIIPFKRSASGVIEAFATASGAGANDFGSKTALNCVYENTWIRYKNYEPGSASPQFIQAWTVVSGILRRITNEFVPIFFCTRERFGIF